MFFLLAHQDGMKQDHHNIVLFLWSLSSYCCSQWLYIWYLIQNALWPIRTVSSLLFELETFLSSFSLDILCLRKAMISIKDVWIKTKQINTKHPKQKFLFGWWKGLKIKEWKYFKLVSFNYNSTKLLFGVFLCHIFKHFFLYNGKITVIWYFSNLSCFLYTHRTVNH